MIIEVVGSTKKQYVNKKKTEKFLLSFTLDGSEQYIFIEDDCRNGGNYTCLQ